MRLTLKEARESLWNTVVPTLQGVDPQSNLTYIQLFTNYINQAQERLINSGKWGGMLREVRFLVDRNGESFTLPRRMVSALAVKFHKDCLTWPGRVQNVWYSYLPFTQNIQDRKSWPFWGYNLSNFSDQGDGYPTTYDSPFEQYYVRLTVEDPSDAGKEVIIKGNSPSGQPLYSVINGQTAEAIQLTLTGTSVTSAEVFGGQVSFVSKELTSGYVALEAVDVLTGDSFQIGYYEPGETTIALRRYKAYSGWNLDSISAICKLRYVAAQTDSDEIVPANIGALKNALMALKFEEVADQARYQEYFNTALGLLNDELKESDGGAEFKLRIDNAAFQLGNVWQGY